MDFVQRFGNNHSVSSVLLSDDSYISGSDISGLVENALNNILQKSSSRAESFQLLARYCSRHSYARLSLVVDQLPTLVEFCQANERQALLELLESLFLDYNSDVSVKLPKVLTKLVTVICNLASSNDSGTSQYGLRIIQILGESKARPIMLNHTKAVRAACIKVLTENVSASASQVDLMAQVYGLYSSMESVDNWMAKWNDVVVESSVLISVLGVGVSKSAAKKNNKDKNNKAAAESESRFVLLKGCQLEGLRGAQKALRGEALFRGLCRIKAELLRFGCSSGFVSLNFTQFLPILQTLLSAAADVNTKDPVVSNLCCMCSRSSLMLLPCANFMLTPSISHSSKAMLVCPPWTWPW